MTEQRFSDEEIGAAEELLIVATSDCHHYPHPEMVKQFLTSLADLRERCAVTCSSRAERQRIRAVAEGNDFALERAVEADGCARDVRTTDLLRSTP